MNARQLALDLGHRPAQGRDDFLVAASNEAAVRWIDRWPDWPAPGLVLWGPPGCGKSHLAAVWRHRAGGPLLTPGDLAGGEPPALLDGAGRATIEDVDSALPDDGLERPLLHLHNVIAERRGALLMTAREPPARWPVALADLASRVKALPAVTIERPDDRLLAAVLVKLFADRQLAVSADVIEYALPRIERSFAAAQALVDALDKAALVAQRRITTPLARDVLNAGALSPPPA